MKKTIIICLFLLSVLGISSNMVLFHGMGGTGSSMLWYKDMLGINNYTYITPTYNCKNSIEQEAINMDKTDFFNQSIFIGYSQGGLIARSIMNQTTAPSVKTFITIGTPNNGAGICNINNEISYILSEAAIVVTPILVDCQPEKPLFVNFVSSKIGEISLPLRDFFNYIKTFTDIQINLDQSLLGFFPSIANAMIPTRGMQDMSNSSAYINQLRTQKMPTYNSDGEKIVYGSIYGNKKGMFNIINKCLGNPAGAIFEITANVVALYYTGMGCWYTVSGGWWNILRKLAGLSYMVSGAVLFSPCQQILYDNLLICSSESDGVVSSDSAEIKSTYVQSEGFVLPKKLVDGADHIDLNSERIITAVKYILEVE